MADRDQEHPNLTSKEVLDPAHTATQETDPIDADQGFRERAAAVIAGAALRTSVTTTAEQKAIPTSPFLLPICCACGGGTRLVRVEPHPTAEGMQDLRSFACVDCGAEQGKLLVRPK
jgi:hypothetical protein